MNTAQLDNPVWFSLSHHEARFNAGNDQVKYFQKDVAPFLSSENWNAADRDVMLQILPDDRRFYVLIPGQVQMPEGFDLIYTTPIIQMVCRQFQPHLLKHQQVHQLTTADIESMIDLTSRMRPGPFLQRTIEFGPYTGIKHHNVLAAMAGERMHLDGFTEVSAVCTDPAYLGKGYASHLMSLACQHIIERGETPFLHVRTDNERAIKAYERLGFVKRTDVFFAIIQKKVD